MNKTTRLIFESGAPGRKGYDLPALDVPARPVNELLPASMLQEKPVELPEVSEGEGVRHFVGLSRLNFGVDSGFYPLGSCTMKYNPKVNETAVRLPGFSRIHPYQPESTVQGALQILWEMDRYLSEITGMDRFTMQPAAGAHGELTGLMIIRAYHEHNGHQRRLILCPDSAHGTNPASAAAAGFEVVQVKSDARGNVDLDDLRAKMSPEVAGLMLTNPNTLGLFEENILDIAEIVHSAGALLYYDGANLNAILGKARPGDMGFDVLHVNLHKTFSTPHGGGGPGSGPVGVKEHLVPFLPKPLVEKQGGKFILDHDRPLSIGRVHSFLGNFGVIVKAYAYIRSMGAEGLTAVAENAVLNANYLLSKLKEHFELPYDRICKHEFVLSGKRQKDQYGVRTLDLAKRLLDFGYHAPTVYFPLIVEEAIMIEPTETESRETLDEFANALIGICREAAENPDLLHHAPHTTPVGRLDETTAARKPVVKWQHEQY